MSSFDWERFLKRWSQEIVASIGDAPGVLPLEVHQSGWLGYPGATEKQITRAEARLGCTLPPSYRAFLRVTNGWRQTPLLSNQLWSLQEIAWFAGKHQTWIDAFWENAEHHPPETHNAKAVSPSIPDDEYFVYGAEQDCSKIRVEYLQTALEISKRSDGAIYLLNPQIVTPDGEWEAWFFGDWLPGADRYQSFQEMMQAEYENFLELRETPTNAHLVAPVLQADPDADIAIDTISPSSALEPALAPIALSPEAANLSSVPALDEGWQALASFTINIQTHPAQHEQRTIICHQETDTVEMRSDVDTAAMQQWMLEQLSRSANQALAEETLGLEITQLRVIRFPQTKQPMVVDQVQPLFLDAIQRGEPFALEVSMHVVGSATTRLAAQPLLYRAQCVARHLSTRLDINLGDITAHLASGNQAASIARFPEARLQQPGLYRLKVWVTLQTISASPGYFKVPMLQVV